MLDMLIISIVIVVNIVLTILRIGVISSTNKYYKIYSESAYESMTADDFASSAISEFNIKRLASGEEYTYKQIKQEFKDFLESSGVEVTANGNKISCNFSSETIVFTVSLEGDISYKVK